MHTKQDIVAVSSIENNRSNEKTRKLSIAVSACPGDRTLSEKPIEPTDGYARTSSIAGGKGCEE